MEITLQKKILAVVTEGDSHVFGGVPIFIGKEKKDREELAILLEKILDGMAHQLNEKTLIIVRH